MKHRHCQRRYKQDHDGEEEYDNDGGLDLVEKRDRGRGDAGKQAERQKQRQVRKQENEAPGEQSCRLELPSHPSHR